MSNPEKKRLLENLNREKHWRRWGPYLSERQWGTVREDYSPDGSSWSFFPFDHSAFRTYRWGEDGIAGISDNHQRLCFAFAFWNEKDKILKERLFGLAGGEGNHGEDVKEYYYYLDNVPTHSYMKYLYKYPHDEYPYDFLREENKRLGITSKEFELIDTGIFNQQKYFDIFIEYAKKDAEDLFIKVTIVNRSTDKKNLHILPTLWFRNSWIWKKKEKKQKITQRQGSFLAEHPSLGTYFLYAKESASLLFTENETNNEKLSGGKNITPYVKDSFHEYVIHGKKEAINPFNEGTKAAFHYVLSLGSKEEKVLWFRLTKNENASPFNGSSKLLLKRQKEANDFFHEYAADEIDEDLKNIQRQAFSNLLWTKQYYHYIVEDWLYGDDKDSPPPDQRIKGRNYSWDHLYNDDILSVPDKWEYPWFASWDSAFHAISLAVIDPEFAKRQLTLFTREWYMHPNGQIPAYEWNFSDVNPPVHAWAAWRVFKIEQKRFGREDRHFLSSIFQKLLINFTWWVNRKDQEGKNLFQGGFLGLDNISIFNRSEDLPTGGSLTQADATSWMAMYCLNMLTIAIELAPKDPSYEDMASKFFEHFLYIADAINYHRKDVPSLWDEEDGFYYDLLHLPNGEHKHVKVRSLVGLVPLFAVAILSEEKINQLHGFSNRFTWFLRNRENLCSEVACMKTKGIKDRHILAILDKDKLKKILEKVLDENEFLSPFGIRSVSKCHKEHPYILEGYECSCKIDYEPGESSSTLFGGNSNWRGPIWFPMNFLLIESLQKFYYYYGDDFKVEFPTGSNHYLTLWDVAGEIAKRLMSIFKKDENGFRAVYNKSEILQKDPFFKDYILFYEYFHGDDGSGLGASHQTGWTSTIAKLILQYGEYVCELE